MVAGVLVVMLVAAVSGSWGWKVAGSHMQLLAVGVTG